MRRARSAGLVSSVLLFNCLARADDAGAPARARLEWTRSADAESCIDGQSLGEAVDRRWGRRVFVDDATANVTVKGSVGSGRHGGWAVHLELERSDGSKLGSRDIITKAADCSALDDSVALALGLMLDLTERPAAEQAQSTAGPVVSGAPITVPKETMAPRVPWHLEPAVGAEAAIGLLPGLVFGGRLSLAIEPPRLWRIELGGTLWQHRDAESGATGARFSMWTMDIAICPLAVDGETTSVRACVAQRAGMIRAAGTGFDRNSTSEDALLAAEARFGVAWSFAPPFSAQAALALDVPLVRLAYLYRDGAETPSVYRMSPVAGLLALGIGARF